MHNGILQGLADNPPLMEAVRAEILRQFVLQTELKDENVSDELLGQMLRARLTGTKIVEQAFKEIGKYKSLPKEVERINPAR